MEDDAKPSPGDATNPGRIGWRNSVIVDSQFQQDRLLLQKDFSIPRVHVIPVTGIVLAFDFKIIAVVVLGFVEHDTLPDIITKTSPEIFDRFTCATDFDRTHPQKF